MYIYMCVYICVYTYRDIHMCEHPHRLLDETTGRCLFRSLVDGTGSGFNSKSRPAAVPRRASSHLTMRRMFPPITTDPHLGTSGACTSHASSIAIPRSRREFRRSCSTFGGQILGAAIAAAGAAAGVVAGFFRTGACTRSSSAFSDSASSLPVPSSSSSRSKSA